ncbi:MAG: DEAD/DEAH box helicase, partial [Inhella sp.]
MNQETPRSRPEAPAAPLPPITFPESLPVSARRDEIAAAMRAHQVVIVCGETGSGKTTQLPKIALTIGRGKANGGGLIGHTQPRRLAATSVAKRIAEELNSPLGDVVGYKIRFNDRITPGASVKLMTDGILLAETQTDPLLKRYDTLIIDEAHERSLNIDFLLGYLKQLLPRRPDLKIVVTSATIDADRFAKHFESAKGPAPVIQVSGRLFPVEQRWRPFEEKRDYGVAEAVRDAVDELWRSNGPGDCLVFLPGEREIREV